MFAPFRLKRSRRLAILILACMQAGLTSVICGFVASQTSRGEMPEFIRQLQEQGTFAPVAAGAVALWHLPRTSCEVSVPSSGTWRCVATRAS